VVPFLLGNTFVARLDLKADRAASTLRVLSAHYEPAVKPKEIIEPLRGEMAELATWLKLERIVVSKRGNLAGALALSLR
jgi:uncharacterized protein YcaQ